MKRARVRRIFGSLPRHVRYVDADLSVSGQLEKRLGAAGYRDELRTLVIWSGVTPYIPEHGVASVLGWVARAAAPRQLHRLRLRLPRGRRRQRVLLRGAAAAPARR